MRYSFLEEAWNNTSIDQFDAPVVSTENVQNNVVTGSTHQNVEDKSDGDNNNKEDTTQEKHIYEYRLNRQELFNTVVYVVGGIFLIQVLDIFVRLGKKST